MRRSLFLKYVLWSDLKYQKSIYGRSALWGRRSRYKCGEARFYSCIEPLAAYLLVPRNVRPKRDSDYRLHSASFL